jgi:2-aminoadipate transaminase
MRLSARAYRLESSTIREILKLTERPGIISFAGGLPAPQTFPIDRLRAVCDHILATDAAAALQYSRTEGYSPLREWIADYRSTVDRRVEAEQVLVTSGSQQALDLIGKVLVDTTRSVLVERPCYLGALQALAAYEAPFTCVPSDEFGPVPAAVDAAAARHEVSCLYVVPNFQNPTGRSIPLRRREELLACAHRNGLIVIEDDPYGELSYGGSQLPSMVSLDPSCVVHVGSFSKILAPGLRVGYLIAPPTLLPRLVQAKQAADLHTPTLTQRMVYETVQQNFMTRHLQRTRSYYAEQCRSMCSALRRYLPTVTDWVAPQGGMFIWVRLAQGTDASKLLTAAIAENVAFVPGAPFYFDHPETNTLRLSFATVPAALIEEGVSRLGGILNDARMTSRSGPTLASIATA